ncbi:hypothetical protein ACP4OV_031576 [Aristida adscensionis]
MSRVQACRRMNVYRVGFIDPNIVHEESVPQWPDVTADNIYKALHRQHTSKYILFPYNFGFHWVLLAIHVEVGRVVVYDSRRNPLSSYQGCINLLQQAWARFQKKHPGVSDPPGPLQFKTDFPIRCKKDELIEPARLKAIQEELCGFLLDEVIDPKGEYHPSCSLHQINANTEDIDNDE